MNSNIYRYFTENYKSLYDAYRSHYKYVDCGPFMVFFLFGKSYECNEIQELDHQQHWTKMHIEAVGVGSIVEGSDAYVPLQIINDDEFTPDLWDETVTYVNEMADELWNEANAENEDDEEW